MPTATFQQGSSYTGTIDTTINQAKPDNPGGSFLNLFIDYASGAQQQGLLEFTNLFGTGPGQIPIGATITSATLTVNVGDSTVSGGSIYRMTSGWNGNSTWNSLGSGVQVGVETAASPDLTLGRVTTGTQSFNVTSSVQAWLSGATTADQANTANQGWLFTSTNSDGWKFSSSEGGTAPSLVITYSMPSAQLAIQGPVSMNEGTSGSPTSFVFTVNRTGDTSGTTSVNYGITGSGANPADASDFSGGVLPSGTVTFAPGQTSQTITVNVGADSVIENNENFTVTLSNSTGGSTITTATSTGTIVNDDAAPPQISIEGPVSLNEGTSASPTAFVFTVDRTGDTSGTTSVNYGVTGSGAAPADASDFSGGVLPSGTVTFAPGQTSQTITVNVAGDSSFESDEGFTVTLSNSTGGSSITGATSSGTIVNDDVAPQLSLAGSVSQSEGTSATPTSFVFTVNRTGDTSGTVAVNYAVAGSGANPVDAGDFAGGVLPSGTVTFAPGQTSQTITVNIAGDSSFESDEGFLLTLSNPTNGAQIGSATATGTVVNDDAAPPTGPVTVTFQQGASYTGTLDTTVKEAQPNTNAGSSVNMYVDAGTGSREQALLQFGNLFGTGPGQIPVGATITSAVLTLNVTNASGNGGGIYRMTTGWNSSSTWNSLGSGVQIGVESAGSADLTLGKVAVGAQSFNVTTSLQAWLSGATTAAQANGANQGWVFNTNSTDAWVFTSSEGTSAPSLVVTYTMPGSTPPPMQLALAGPVSQNEGTSESPTAFTFTVNRTGDTSIATSVKYAVSGGGANGATFSDFTSGVLPSGTVNFAVGETSKTITINVVGDTSVENNENFLVTLSNATNGATIAGATATGTILNDDPTNGFRGINIIQGSSYGNGDPSSPDRFGSTDPTDIARAADGTFYLVDSEVDETPHFGTVNMWHLDAQGHLIAPVSIEAFTKEPTGIAAWASGGKQYLFITDDDVQKIYKIDAANPTVVLSTISTTKFGCADPEDICINQNNGNLFVMSENDHKIYEITQSGTLVATTVLPNTFVPHTDPLAEDAGAEAVAYDPVKDVFYVTGGFSPDIFEISRSGQILNMINVLEQYPNPSLVNTPQGVYLKGIELAPSSDGSGHMSLWVTDYGRDQYPDGRVIEIMLNDTTGQAAASTTSMSIAASNLALQDAAATQGSGHQHPALLDHGAQAWMHAGNGLNGASVHDWLQDWAKDHDNSMHHLF